MERLKSERDKAINILHFTTPESIPSVYYDKSYLVAPDGSCKAYELLRRAMMERGVIGITKSVLWSKETMMALIPEDNGIRMQTLFYQNQITEGINNSIKALKRATFGMPNFHNFRARILHCHSNP